MLEEIRPLFELQKLDESLSDLVLHLKELEAQRARLVQKVRDEEQSVERLREQLAALERDSRLSNLEVDELDMHIRDYQKRLDEGIISFKEMEDLRLKIASEKKRMSTLEDTAITLMDSIEESRGKVAQAAASLEKRLQELQAQIHGVDEEAENATARLEDLTKQRENHTSAIPSYLLKQYGNLCAKFSNPVVEIQNGVCTGCKLRVSGNTVERAKGNMGITTCEHCSRILFVS